MDIAKSPVFVIISVVCERRCIMTEIKKDNGGFVRIADDVLARIAGAAAMEVEGVAGLAGLAGYLESVPKAVRKQMPKGISVNVANQTVTLGLAITVRIGTKLHEVAMEVQQRIKSAIETMTGLNVAEVNVSVGAVIGIKQRRV